MIEREFPDRTRIVSLEHADGATELCLEADGKKVSQIIIVPMLMRVGAAVVRMDGIGGVATDEQYRHRGFSRRLMETAVEKMRGGDAAISTLYGIPDFYPKFGYATTGPEYTVHLRLPDDRAVIPSLPDGWTFRPFAADDLPAVQRIYHANTRRATGALVRHETDDDLEENRRLAHSSPAASRIGRRAWKRLAELPSRPDGDACRVLVNRSGEITACAWVGKGTWWINFRQRDAPESFHLGEVMASDPTAADAVLAACQLGASESDKRFTRIEVVVPPEGPVAHAAAYEGGSFLALHSRRGQFMGRVLDVGRLLSQLQPELSARVRRSCQPFRGQLTLHTEIGDGTLDIDSGGVSVGTDQSGTPRIVEIPQETLARLCLGAFETADLLARLPTRPDGETASLLKVLFPRRFPHIYPADRF